MGTMLVKNVLAGFPALKPLLCSVLSSGDMQDIPAYLIRVPASPTSAPYPVYNISLKLDATTGFAWCNKSEFELPLASSPRLPML